MHKLKRDHWTRTARKPLVVDGHEFLSYRHNVNAYLLYCEKIDATVHSYAQGSIYMAEIGNQPVRSPRTGRQQRFRSERGAINGAIREAKKKAVQP